MGPKVLVTENSRTQLMVSNDKENRNEVQHSKQFIAAGLATLIAFGMGMFLSWTSAAIPTLRNSADAYEVTASQEAWVGSILNIGAFTGAIPAGAITSLLGRKRTLQLLAFPLFVSWFLTAYGGCVEALYVARFLAGLAVGAASVAAPMYVAELAHSSIRGTLGTFFQMQITIGLLAEYILGAIITDFKMLAIVSSIILVVFLVSFSFMPESPVYLSEKDRKEEAKQSLSWFRGENYDVEDELLKINDNIREARVNKAKISDLTNCKATYKGLIISLGLMLFQQLSGINAVLFYGANIFQQAGSSLPPNVCTIIIGAVQVAATFASTLLIDRAGRKILLFISALVMCICLSTLAVYFYLKNTMDLPAQVGIVPLLSLGLFIIVFSLGFGPIPWMIVGEMMDPKVKGLVCSIAAAFNWLIAFTVTNQFLPVVNSIGIEAAFGLFAIICGIGAVFVLVLVPETKGRDIEQVKSILNGTDRAEVTNLRILVATTNM